MTIELCKELERPLQEYLTRRGLSEDTMPGIVEEAIEAFLFQRLFDESHDRNVHTDPDEIDSLRARAVWTVRHDLPDLP